MEIVYTAKSIHPRPTFYALSEFDCDGARSFVNFSSSARFVQTDGYDGANAPSPIGSSSAMWRLSTRLNPSVHKASIDAINNKENMNVRIYFKELDHT